MSTTGSSTCSARRASGTVVAGTRITLAASMSKSGVNATMPNAPASSMATITEKRSMRANAPPCMPFTVPRLVSMYEGDSATTASG